jgi:SAM-dependent methyltransferase
MTSRREQIKRALRGAPGWEKLVLTKALVIGGQPRQTAVAQILKPKNLFQPYATTGANRYPDEFAVVAETMTTTSPTILSFGCSSGEELLSLHQHFPSARIHGIDVNPLAIRTARKRVRAAGLESSITVAKGGDTGAESPASYDAVMALAVFRHGALNDGPPSCEPTLWFADFERTVTGLADCVRPGGVLVIRHANFRFADCAIAEQFELVRSGYVSVGDGGLPTPVYDRDNELLDLDLRDDGIYRRRIRSPQDLQ